MQPSAGGGGGFTTTLDIAALVGAILWPLLIAVAVLLFRDRIVEAVKWLAPHVRSVSLGPVSLEVAAARPLRFEMTGAVDLRHAGQPGDVNDSTLRSFYDQIRDPAPLDYAIVDLGTGAEWLTSRLYILAVILSRMRGLRAFVFVETAGDVRRRLVGVAECEQVRWRMAMRYPWLEAALAHAQCAVWPAPAAMEEGNAPFAPVIGNGQGRLQWSGGNPEPAAELLRAFLTGIQRPVGPVSTADNWETLPCSTPPVLEHARWLTGEHLEQIMLGALDQSSISITELNRSDERTKARLLLAQTGRWVAVTRDDRVFDRLLDRLGVLEAVAQQRVRAEEG